MDFTFVLGVGGVEEGGLRMRRGAPPARQSYRNPCPTDGTKPAPSNRIKQNPPEDIPSGGSKNRTIPN